MVQKLIKPYRPLYPTFAGPFAEPGSRPMQPDFRLPECYTVDNIHSVKDKVPHFSDETLFWIFYTQTRDIIQEFAAMELYVSQAGPNLELFPLTDPMAQNESQLAIPYRSQDVAYQRHHSTRANTNESREGARELCLLQSDGLGEGQGA